MANNADMHHTRFHGLDSLFGRKGDYSWAASAEQSATVFPLSARLASQTLEGRQASATKFFQTRDRAHTGAQNHVATLRTSSSMTGLPQQAASGATPRIVTSSVRSYSARLERSRAVSVVSWRHGRANSFQSHSDIDQQIPAKHCDDSYATPKRPSLMAGEASGLSGEGPLHSARYYLAGTSMQVAAPSVVDSGQYPGDALACPQGNDNRDRQARHKSPLIVRRQSADMLTKLYDSGSGRISSATPPKPIVSQSVANVVKCTSACGHQDRHLRSPSPLVVRRQPVSYSAEVPLQGVRDSIAGPRVRSAPSPMAESQQSAADVSLQTPIDSSAPNHKRSGCPRSMPPFVHQDRHVRSPSPLVVRRLLVASSVEVPLQGVRSSLTKSWQSAADVIQCSPIDSTATCQKRSGSSRSVSPSPIRRALQPLAPCVASASQQQVSSKHQGTSQVRFSNCEEGVSDAFTTKRCMSTPSLDAMQRVARGASIAASVCVATDVPVPSSTTWAATLAAASPLKPTCASRACNSGSRQCTQRVRARSSSAFCESSMPCCPLSDAPAQDWQFEYKPSHDGNIGGSNVTKAEAITDSKKGTPHDVGSSWDESETSLQVQTCDTEDKPTKASFDEGEEFAGGHPKKHTPLSSGSAASHASLPTFTKRRPAFTIQAAEGPYKDNTSQSTTSPEAAASPASSAPSSPDLPTPRTCRIVSLRSLECTSVDV